MFISRIRYWYQNRRYRRQRTNNSKSKRSVAGRTLTVAELSELQHFHTLGIYYNEQNEFMAARCCEILGVDPEADSLERDLANEIVYHGTQPVAAIESINSHYRRLVG